MNVHAKNVPEKHFISMGLTPDVTRKRYDVVVSGAGPAGCIAAHLLSRTHSVLLVEEKQAGAAKPCGGLLAQEGILALADIGLEVPASTTELPARLSCRIVDEDHESLEVCLPQTVLNTDRSALNAWFRELVSEQITRLYSFAVIDVQRRGTALDLVLCGASQRYPVNCDYLVVAEGAGSRTRRKLVKSLPPFRTATQVVSPPVRGLESFYMIYSEMITDFYIWVIPKSAHTVVGTGLRRPQGTRQTSVRICHFLRERRGWELSPSEVSRSLLTDFRSETDLWFGDGHILCIGEAAGLVSPSSGEGISYAVRSASMAAKIVLSDGAACDLRDESHGLIEELKDKRRRADLIAQPGQRESYLQLH